MAAKKADKAKDKPKKEGGGGGAGIMGLVSKILGVLAILSAAVLFAAAFDVGHMGLKKSMASLAIAPLGVYVLFGIAALFLGGSKAASAPPDTEALTARIDELQSKTTSRLSAMQGSIDALSGQDYEALLAENKALKEQLDAIHEAERGKIDDEVEKLRSKNAELEQQIKDWAVKTVAAQFGDGEEETEEAA